MDNICDYACRTNLVTKEEIRVSELSGSRFLIMLPKGLDPDTFINATPHAAWDDGLSFQPWSPLEDTNISIPSYKVLLTIVGLPPHLFKEKYMSLAMARFGVFLGSVAPEKPSSLSNWMVAVGVYDLTLIPPEIAIHIGGMIHTARLHILAWDRTPLYKAEDMPKNPKKYLRPQPPPSSSSSSDSENCPRKGELIPMSSHVLRQMCRGRTAASLPPELRRFASLEEMETSDMPAQFPEVSQSVQSVLHNSEELANPKVAIYEVAGQHIDQVAEPHSDHTTLAHMQSADESLLAIEPKKAAGSQHGKDPMRPESMALSPNVPIKLLTKPPQQPGTQRQLLRQNQLGINPDVDNGRKSAPLQRIPNQEKDKSSKGPDVIRQCGNRGENIVQKMFPIPREGSFNRHVSGGIQQGIVFHAQGIVFHAQGKRPAQGPSTIGPSARKFKWTRPVPNNAQVTKKLIAAASNKRKNATTSTAGPSKKPASKNKPKELAEVSFNTDGFYEVKVQYEHISNLASGCRFKAKDVEEIIKLDNTHRQAQASQQVASTPIPSDDEEPDLSRFEPDPRDELTSDEEGA